MSALPPKADIRPDLRNVRYVPIADIGRHFGFSDADMAGIERSSGA